MFVFLTASGGEKQPANAQEAGFVRLLDFLRKNEAKGCFLRGNRSAFILYGFILTDPEQFHQIFGQISV
ncbi:MAG: hypothetical protein OIF58_07345 [Cohaesibacter sp.]|nr:hypothetical protein [Cohaesibacter sp.]